MKIKTTWSFRIRRITGNLVKAIPKASSDIQKYVSYLVSRLRLRQMEEEIFESCIILKNLAIVYEKMPMTEDFIMEQLMDSSRNLRAVYADILSALRNGQGQASFEILYNAVPSSSAKAFVAILKKLSSLNPAELIEQMTSFEETFSDERITKGMKKAERGSVITTVTATITVFAVLLNFTTVVVFMDAINMIKNLI